MIRANYAHEMANHKTKAIWTHQLMHLSVFYTRSWFFQIAYQKQFGWIVIAYEDLASSLNIGHEYYLPHQCAF